MRIFEMLEFGALVVWVLLRHCVHVVEVELLEVTPSR